MKYTVLNYQPLMSKSIFLQLIEISSIINFLEVNHLFPILKHLIATPCHLVFTHCELKISTVVPHITFQDEVVLKRGNAMDPHP